MRRYVAPFCVALLLPVVTRAQPAPANDSIPALIEQAKSQTNDPATLSATLGEILRNISHASDEELKEIGDLRNQLSAKLAQQHPPDAQAAPAREPAQDQASVESTRPASDNTRAREMFGRAQAVEKTGDIQTARRLYRVAANENYAPAARALAQLYDPAYLAKLNVIGGVSGNVVDARRWYERAASLGDQDAPEMLAKLPR